MIDDPVLALDLAELALAAEDLRRPRVMSRSPKPEPELEADALHLLGRVHELRDERAGDDRGLEAGPRARCRRRPAPPVSISDDEVERIALAALELLPAEVRAKLANVPILIDDVPSEGLVEDGTDPRLLGLFSGAPMADGHRARVTNIHLSQAQPRARGADDLDELAERGPITVSCTRPRTTSASKKKTSKRSAWTFGLVKPRRCRSTRCAGADVRPDVRRPR